MIGGLSVSESAIEALSSVNYFHNSLFPCGFPLLRRPIAVTVPRRKKHTKITTRSDLSDGSGIVLDKEFEFKPSFDEYLKAMESVKSDRGSDDNSHSRPRRKRFDRRIVREEDEDDDEVTAAREYSRRSDFSKRNTQVREDSRQSDFSKRNTQVREDSRRSDFSKRNTQVREDYRQSDFSKRNTQVREDSRQSDFSKRNTQIREDSRKAEKKQNNVKIGNEKRSGWSESKFLDMDRAAFRSLEDEDDVIDKPRITKVDMEERIQKLAKGLNGADIKMPEWKFSQMMRSAQIRFSDHSILRIIQILGKLGNWRRVLQVIEWIQSRERFKSHKIRHVYCAALDALGKARRPVEALNLFYRMQEQMASYPDIAAYHCIAVTLGQAGYMKELFDVIDTMRSPPKKKSRNNHLEKWDPRLQPDIIVYNAVLNACVRRQNWEGAFWVLQQLSERGLQPSSTTYGLVMEVMLVCGKYNLVHDFFRKLQKSHVPNALVYKVLVNTLWKEGKINEAILAVEQMEKRGIVGNAALYYDLARCLCSAGRCNEGLKQIDKICKVANKPLVVTYTGLIQACLDSGGIKNGAYIFDRMQKFCSPNLITCNIMLKAFLDHGMFQEAKQLFTSLLENGNSISREEDYKVRVVPDIYSFNTMLDGCAVGKRWDDVVFVYERMLEFGYHFNAKRHLRLVLDARRAGKDKPLEITWKYLLETERAPPPVLIAEMLCMRVEQGDYAVGLSYVNNFASVESQVLSRKFWLKFFTENAHRFEKGGLDELVKNGVGVQGENVVVEHLIDSCKEFLSRQSRH